MVVEIHDSFDDFIHDIMPDAKPGLKLVATVLSSAFKDGAGSVTFVRRKKEGWMGFFYTSKGYGECEIVPLTCYCYSEIMKILRRLGRLAAKNSESALSFSYAETGDEKKFVLYLDYIESDTLKAELIALLDILYMEEKIKDQLKRIKWNHEALTATVFLLLVVSAILAFHFWRFFF